MAEMNDLDKWTLETAKDIDEKLRECAEKWGDPHKPSWDNILKIQKVRIDLVRSIRGREENTD